MMLYGIGNKENLEEIGIKNVIRNIKVGENLKDNIIFKGDVLKIKKYEY